MLPLVRRSTFRNSSWEMLGKICCKISSCSLLMVLLLLMLLFATVLLLVALVVGLGGVA